MYTDEKLMYQFFLGFNSTIFLLDEKQKIIWKIYFPAIRLDLVNTDFGTYRMLSVSNKTGIDSGYKNIDKRKSTTENISPSHVRLCPDYFDRMSFYVSPHRLRSPNNVFTLTSACIPT